MQGIAVISITLFYSNKSFLDNVTCVWVSPGNKQVRNFLTTQEM